MFLNFFITNVTHSHCQRQRKYRQVWKRKKKKKSNHPNAKDNHDEHGSICVDEMTYFVLIIEHNAWNMVSQSV